MFKRPKSAAVLTDREPKKKGNLDHFFKTLPPKSLEEYLKSEPKRWQKTVKNDIDQWSETLEGTLQKHDHSVQVCLESIVQR